MAKSTIISKFVLASMTWLFMMLMGCGNIISIVPPTDSPKNLNGTSQADSASITLTWDSVVGAESYNLFWDTLPGVTLSSNRIINVTSPYIHRDLLLGLDYYYRINAENSAGESGLSNELKVSLLEKLQPPANVMATPGHKSVRITWDSVVGASSYTIFWSDSQFVNDLSKSIPNVTSPYDHSNLIVGKPYYYRVKAIHGDNSSDLSVEVTGTPITSIPLPPVNLKGAPGDGFVQLDWDTIANIKYNIYYGKQPGITKNDPKFENKKPPYEHSGLTNGETIYYRVTAENEFGESDLSVEINVTPKPGIILPPSNLTAIAGDSMVTLSWDSVTEATSYNIYWGTHPNITKDSSKLSGIINTTFDHKPLINGTPYYYRVTTVKGQIESELSEEVNATPTKKLLPPTGVLASAGNQNVNLNWDVVGNATSYNIYWDEIPNVTTNSNLIDDVKPPFLHENLTNEKTYYYRISSVNATQESELSEEVNATPVNLTVLPPADVKAEPADAKVTVTWAEVANATSYNIYWANEAGVTTNSNTQVGVTSPFEHLSLTNGTPYYYRVTAVNSAGESQLSEEVNATPVSVIDPPKPPANVKATPGDGKVNVSWDTSVSATSYNIYWANEAGVTTNSSLIEGITSPYEHLNLTNGTPYYYRVTAVNSSGESQLSEEVTATPVSVVNPPKPPANIQATPGNTRVDVSWDTSVSATSYNIYWANEAGVTTNSNSEKGVTSPFEHINLTNGTPYYYRVTAVNSAGESQLSEEVNATPSDENNPPLPPFSVKAKPGNAKVVITWKTSSSVTSYNIYWAKEAGVTKNSNSEKGVTSPFEHLNLTNGTPYYYRVTAVNNSGESELSREVNATPENITPPPEPPVKIVVTPSDKLVTIKWDNVSGATSYNIYWANLPGVTKNAWKISDAKSPYAHDDLVNGRDYYYRISAIGSAGEGDLSDEFKATPLSNNPAPKTPENVKTTGGNEMITLTWDEVPEAKFYNIYWSLDPNVNKKSEKIAGITQNNYEHKGLKNGTVYYYCITAENNNGESALSEYVFNKPFNNGQVPPPPRNVKAEGGDKEINLTWDKVSNATSYTIYWGLTVNTPNKIVKVTNNSYKHAGLEENKTYFYRVSSVNENGEGSQSNRVNAKTNKLLAFK